MTNRKPTTNATHALKRAGLCAIFPGVPRAARMAWALVFIFAQAAPCEIISPDRRITWQGNVGIPGGIPQGWPVFTSVKSSPYNAKGDGVTDDTAAVQAAVDACPPNQVVYFPPGTYNLSSSINVGSHTILRGAGPGQTTLVLEGILVQPSTYPRTVYDWTAGYAKGSTQVTLGNTNGLSVGMEIELDELNDPSFMNPVGGEGLYVASGRTDTNPWNGSTRCAPQLVTITGINGQHVTIDPPLYLDHDPSLVPQAFSWNGNRQWVGIEDMTIDCSQSLTDWQIDFTMASYCWIKNVDAFKQKRAAVLFRYAYRGEVRDSYIHESRGVGSTTYGVELMMSSGILIENNMFSNVVCPIMVGAAVGGSVFGYNYATNPPAGWLYGSIFTHAVHTHMNLFEGNVVPSEYHDFIHGSGSHNTVFRTVLPGWTPTATTDIKAIVLQAWNRYYNIVGNILGTAGVHTQYETTILNMHQSPPYEVYTLGFFDTSETEPNGDPTTVTTLLRHGNYDTATQGVVWDGTISDHNLPASLYLPGQPSWWGNLRWPANGPDLNPMVGKIPAQLRYETVILPGIRPSSPGNLKVVQ